jgi:hypothetical protein
LDPNPNVNPKFFSDSDLLQSFGFFRIRILNTSVAEPHHFYAAPGTNFDAAPAAPAPVLLYTKAKFLK